MAARTRPAKIKRANEFELIARYFAPFAAKGAFGLRDDAAILAPPPGYDLVITKDMLVADRHFFASDPPASIARKALRVNLSDLAAKGAKPLGFLLGLALPEDWKPKWLEDFSRGLAEDSKLYNCPLFGGDTVKASAKLTLSVTAFGSVPKGRMVRRQTAKPGDLLFVSGTIGDAALGLLLRRKPRPAWGKALGLAHRGFLLDRYLHPQPRVALSGAVLKYASAAMDISDGLAGDLGKMLCKGISAEIRVASVPLSEAARAAIGIAPSLIETVLTGGDDYEILAAVPEKKAKAFLRATRGAFSEIGMVIEGDGAPVFRDARGKPLKFKRASHDHFGS